MAEEHKNRIERTPEERKKLQEESARKRARGGLKNRPSRTDPFAHNEVKMRVR